MPDKVACLTLDFERDYGDRIGEFNLLHDTEGLSRLGQLFRELSLPVSAFICTDLLVEYPSSLAVVEDLAVDYHCHSHTHDTDDFDSARELRKTAATFTDQFGYAPLGYRAPMGVLYPDDIMLLKEHGFKFSASVFPTWRPGRFNNRSLPLLPFRYGNGIIELPFAAIPGIRSVVSLSYLKMLGWWLNRLGFGLCGLPDVLVIDSHLHDFLVDEKSFRQLPWKLQLAWSRNKYAGCEYLARLVQHLRQRGYRFITMTRLYELLVE